MTQAGTKAGAQLSHGPGLSWLLPADSTRQKADTLPIVMSLLGLCFLFLPPSTTPSKADSLIFFLILLKLSETK